MLSQYLAILSTDHGGWERWNQDNQRWSDYWRGSWGWRGVQINSWLSEIPACQFGSTSVFNLANESEKLLNVCCPQCRVCHQKVGAKDGNTSNLYSHLKKKASSALYCNFVNVWVIPWYLVISYKSDWWYIDCKEMQYCATLLKIAELEMCTDYRDSVYHPLLTRGWNKAYSMILQPILHTSTEEACEDRLAALW